MSQDEASPVWHTANAVGVSLMGMLGYNNSPRSEHADEAARLELSPASLPAAGPPGPDPLLPAAAADAADAGQPLGGQCGGEAGEATDDSPDVRTLSDTTVEDGAAGGGVPPLTLTLDPTRLDDPDELCNPDSTATAKRSPLRRRSSQLDPFGELDADPAASSGEPAEFPAQGLHGYPSDEDLSVEELPVEELACCDPPPPAAPGPWDVDSVDGGDYDEDDEGLEDLTSPDFGLRAQMLSLPDPPPAVPPAAVRLPSGGLNLFAAESNSMGLRPINSMTSNYGDGAEIFGCLVESLHMTSRFDATARSLDLPDIPMPIPGEPFALLDVGSYTSSKADTVVQEEASDVTYTVTIDDQVTEDKSPKAAAARQTRDLVPPDAIEIELPHRSSFVGTEDGRAGGRDPPCEAGQVEEEGGEGEPAQQMPSAEGIDAERTSSRTSNREARRPSQLPNAPEGLQQERAKTAGRAGEEEQDLFVVSPVTPYQTGSLLHTGDDPSSQSESESDGANGDGDCRVRGPSDSFIASPKHAPAKAAGGDAPEGEEVKALMSSTADLLAASLQQFGNNSDLLTRLSGSASPSPRKSAPCEGESPPGSTADLLAASYGDFNSNAELLTRISSPKAGAAGNADLALGSDCGGAPSEHNLSSPRCHPHGGGSPRSANNVAGNDGCAKRETAVDDAGSDQHAGEPADPACAEGLAAVPEYRLEVHEASPPLKPADPTVLREPQHPQGDGTSKAASVGPYPYCPMDEKAEERLRRLLEEEEQRLQYSSASLTLSSSQPGNPALPGACGVSDKPSVYDIESTGYQASGVAPRPTSEQQAAVEFERARGVSIGGFSVFSDGSEPEAAPGGAAAHRSSDASTVQRWPSGAQPGAPPPGVQPLKNPFAAKPGAEWPEGSPGSSKRSTLSGTNRSDAASSIISGPGVNPLEHMVAWQRQRIHDLEREVEDLKAANLFMGPHRDRASYDEKMQSAVNIMLTQASLLERRDAEIALLRRCRGYPPGSAQRGQQHAYHPFNQQQQQQQDPPAGGGGDRSYSDGQLRGAAGPSAQSIVGSRKTRSQPNVQSPRSPPPRVRGYMPS
ncbi:hypothetical protein DIPPA_22488 [Diplonema papillatum]|nr:hypothetical protein DIPPA_22488 [Diplonema papillatum]|eukprot:gene10544-16216_t